MRTSREMQTEYGGDDEATLRELAHTVRAANLLAKRCAKNRAAKARLYAAKNALLSAALELWIPGTRVAWQLDKSSYVLLVSLGSFYSAHSFLETLSSAAICRVVNEIGREPAVRLNPMKVVDSTRN